MGPHPPQGARLAFAHNEFIFIRPSQKVAIMREKHFDESCGISVAGPQKSLITSNEQELRQRDGRAIADVGQRNATTEVPLEVLTVDSFQASRQEVLID